MENEKEKFSLLNVLKGIVIGIANAIPGVSGGTMMVIMNVFDKILGAVSIKNLKKNFWFLVAVVGGAGIGVILASKVLATCFEHYYVQTQFFFLGVIFGSLPMIYKEATKEKKFTPIHAIPFIIGLIVIIGVSIIGEQSISNKVITEMDAGTFIYLTVVSILAAVAMLMPGLSGSLVMLMLGSYETVIKAVDDMNIVMLIPVGIGVLLGIVVCAKMISVCLKKFPLGTYAIILGLIVGSVYAVYPKGGNDHPAFSLSGDSLWTGITAIVMLIIGVALPLFMELLPKLKEKKEKAAKA